MAYSVWIFCDLPVGKACGPSYMVESWGRELRKQGMQARLFTPSPTWWTRTRTASSVTFRTVRHVGYVGDYHARFSSVAELIRARSELPDVILVTTLGRVGLLGITLAAYYSIPLVLVVSTNTTGAVAHYNATRVFSSGGVKPVVLLAAASRARAAMFRRSAYLAKGAARRSSRLAAHCASALHAEASELVLLSPKSLPEYGEPAEARPVTVFPVGIDRLPVSPTPVELTWRDGALRILYVGRFAPEKSLPILIHALSLAVDQGVNAHLALVGEGPLTAKLIALGEQFGVSDRLTVIGPYERSRLGGVYASADVFAFPSVVDTQAFVLNEAAHEGLPLLVSDTANQVVRDGESALVVRHDPVSWAAALVRLQDPALRERLGAGAQSRAQQVGESAQSAKLAEVLLRAIHSRTPRAVTEGRHARGALRRAVGARDAGSAPAAAYRRGRPSATGTRPRRPV